MSDVARIGRAGSTVLSPRRVEFGRAVADIAAGFLNYRIWQTLTWNDLAKRYSRSWIGLGWVMIAFAFFMLVKVVIFGSLSSADSGTFAVHLAIGYMLWRFISGILTDGASTFISSHSWIKSEPIPLSTFVYKVVFTNFVLFVLTSPAVIAICYYFGIWTVGGIEHIPLALAAILVNAVWIALSLGIICARHRDIMHLIRSVMILLYFASPILWMPSDSPTLELIATYNPISYFIEILRGPIMNGFWPVRAWIVVGAFTIGGWLFALFLLARFKNRVVFWL